MTKTRSRTVAGDDPYGEEIEAAVLAYLQRHPHAADTLRGIVNWWLPLQRFETGCQRIERALSEMVLSGVLRRDQLPDGEVLYTLDRKPTRPRQLH